MINYETITIGDVTQITIPTDGPHGTICYAYEHNNAVFMAALADKGIDVYIQLLVYDPGTAYATFTAGYGDGL
jgi:hypothetical protein